jgi:carboxypeptidase family protein/TonB-dependent receptor-like protein
MRIQCSLLLSCAVAVMVSDPALGQGPDSSSVANQGRTYGVSGVVTDGAREPLPQVEIATMDTGSLPNRRTKTDVRGRFDLGRFQQGPLSVRFRRLGYELRTLQLEVGAGGQSTAIEIALMVVPEELAKVEVSAPSEGKLHGFYQRSQQHGTFARFITEEQVRRLNPRNASDLFRTVPGITVGSTQNGGNSIRIRGCQPMVYVDDQRVPGAELDELILPTDIAAIEFYASAAGIPVQYIERGNRLCGLILVWTKTGN